MNDANKFWNIIIRIITVLTIFISCSDETTNEIAIPAKSFLEKNDHTEWTISRDDIDLYIRLNNDESQLIEQWMFKNDLDCYSYNPNIFNPGNFKIKENSIDTLVIDCDPILGDCDCMIITRQENTLKVLVRMSEWEEETVYFNKSSVVLDELTICDGEDDDTSLKFYKP